MIKRQNGFSIVELIVVISVLGILAAISIPRFINANTFARGSKIISDMNACESAINIYFIKTGAFPSNSDVLVPSYIAFWPKPPVGSAMVKKHNNNDLVIEVQATSYVYKKPAIDSELDTRIGRVTLGGLTIEDLLTTSETSLTVTDTD